MKKQMIRKVRQRSRTTRARRTKVRKRSKFVRKKGTKRLKKALRVQNVPRKVLLPTDKRIGVVLSVQNEAQTLPLVLRELSRLPLHELIIIVNGSTDASLSLARNVPGATVVHYQEPVGHDVGRAIGAKLATSDILVFVDADFIIPAERLVPFVTAVDRGMDVALNNISPYLKPSRSLDRVTYLKEFLNRILGRPDLRANSLTAVPHAISRKALDMIGCHQLMVPPKAQASAIIKGLVVGAPGSVEVLKANRHKAGNVGRMNMVSELIAGDHLEALQFAMDELGGRLWFSDHGRRRDLLGGA